MLFGSAAIAAACAAFFAAAAIRTADAFAAALLGLDDIARGEPDDCQQNQHCDDICHTDALL